jgi:hypothetical protein
MGCKRAPAHRTGDDARQVQYPDAGQRAICRRKRLSRRVTDSVDGKEWKLRDGAPLGVLIPLGKRAAGGNHEASLSRRRFQALCIPSIERALDRFAVVAAAKQGEQPVSVVRETGMKSSPSAVAAAIEPGDPVPAVVSMDPVDTQVVFAAELDRRIAHGDADTLTLARPQPPQFGGRERRRRDRRLCRGANRK